MGLTDRGHRKVLSGVNLIATIVKMRAPGMSMMKMPIFTWTALCTNVLIVAAFPILTAVLALVSCGMRRQPCEIDRPSRSGA